MLFAGALHLLSYDKFDLAYNTNELTGNFVSARTSVKRVLLF
jgi:hypothetical protein